MCEYVLRSSSSLDWTHVYYLIDRLTLLPVAKRQQDRCHRLGQERPVRVTRLVMKNSIEMRMLKYQDAKAALGKGSIEKLNKDDLRKAKVTALKDLFQVDDMAELYWDDLDDFIENSDAM